MSNWYRIYRSLFEEISDIDSQIKSIEKEFNVSIKYQIHDNTMRLDNIDRTSNKKGTGSLALQKIIDIANENNLNIYLTVDRGHPKLVKFYINHGFVPDEHYDDIDKWYRNHEDKWYYADEYEPDYDNDEERPEIPWVNMIYYSNK